MLFAAIVLQIRITLIFFLSLCSDTTNVGKIEEKNYFAIEYREVESITQFTKFFTMHTKRPVHQALNNTNRVTKNAKK